MSNIAELDGRLGKDETWLPVPGFEGLYEVSSVGRVKSLRRVVGTKRCWTIPETILAIGSTRKGYACVSLHKDGKAYPREVHRLVCRAFHGESPSKTHHAAHWDGDRTNNAAANLRWATPKENSADRWRHGTVLSGDKNARARTTDIAILAKLKEVCGDLSARKAANDLGISDRALRNIMRGDLRGHLLASNHDLFEAAVRATEMRKPIPRVRAHLLTQEPQA